MKINEQLIAKIRDRKGRGLRMGEGFWTADKYVESLAQCIGVGICQTHFGTAQKTFSQVMKEAAGTLTYAGPHLEIEADSFGNLKLATSSHAIKEVLNGIELPKHAMLAFTHVLTTPREDRDGDVLETEGAVVDTKMPLLWQHVHTLPIGKLLKVVEHTSERLKMASCLLDLNPLTADAAKLFEAGALRFSHGFRALDFSERNKEVAGAIGFRVKSYEIMEESGVSVPSNIDAEVELLSRGKLKSEAFKAHAKAMQKLLGKKFPGMTLKLGGLDELKQAADRGLIKTVADQGVVSLEIGAADGGSRDKHDKPCGCGGKAGQKDGKASMDRESFATRELAEARATELGCTGSHFVDGKWYPCIDQWSYGLYAKPSVDPALGKPTGRASVATANKVYMDSGSLNGSYYNRIAKLSEDANRFLAGSGIELDRDDNASVWALFDGFGIIVVCSYGPGPGGEEYYRADWSESNGEPKWQGVPKEVEVSSDINIAEVGKSVQKSLTALLGTRAGRTLSQANVDRLEKIKQDLSELIGSDVSRSAQALAERCLRIIDDLISSAVPVLDEDVQPKSITPQDAAGIVLESKNIEFIRGVGRAINAVVLAHKQEEKAARFRKFVGRK